MPAWQGSPPRACSRRTVYSYTRVDGAGAAELLARPLDSRIWIAGEATDVDYESALASGTRAAEQVLGLVSRAA